MKVLLLSPTWYSDPELTEVYFPMPPVSLGYLASCLEREGHKVMIFDVLGRDSQIRKVVEDFGPDMIGIQCFSTGFLSFKNTLLEIRKCFRGLVIAGGPHVTAVENIQSELPVDYWVKGDGEKAIVKLANGWQPRKKVIIGEETEALDTIPYPSWHLMELEKYSTNIKYHGMSIISSRGCPYRCIFCFDAHQRKLRFRKPQKVVDEMMELRKKYGFNRFFFMDDTFVISAQRVKEFADLLEGRGIEFACNGRCNVMTEEIVKDLKRAGCFLLYYGVESGVQRILDIMQKRITLEQVINSLELAKKYKIKTSVFMLMSNPTETIDEMYQTMRFSKELYKKYKCTIDLSILYCYPNTPVYHMAGFKIKDWSVKQHNWRYPTVPIYIENGYTFEQMISLYKKFLFEIDFMQTPKYTLPIAAIRYLFRTLKKKLST